MKKNSIYVFLILCILAILITPAFAAPLAKVAAFPGGEGLEELLSSIDSSKIRRVEKASEYDDTAIVIVPLVKDCNIMIYGAVMNDNFEVAPDRESPVIAEGAMDSGLLFWCRVPEGIPAVVTVLYVKEGENLRTEHFWSPAFSGFDGSLVINNEFISF